MPKTFVIARPVITARCPFCGMVVEADLEAEHYHANCPECGETCEVEYNDPFDGLETKGAT